MQEFRLAIATREFAAAFNYVLICVTVIAGSVFLTADTLDCDRQLRKTLEALEAWRRTHNGIYPDKLADLVSVGFLPLESAFCPNVRRELSASDARHELATSRGQGRDAANVYEYELFPLEVSKDYAAWLPPNPPSYTRRDLKLILLRRPFSEQVPLVRCSSHRTGFPPEPDIARKPMRNLTATGEIYWSGENWEAQWLSDVPLAARGANLVFGLKGPPFFVDVPPTPREALDLRSWSSAFGDHPWWWDLPMFDEAQNSHWAAHLRPFFQGKHGVVKIVAGRSWWVNGLVQLHGKTRIDWQERYQKFSMQGFPWDRAGLSINRKFRKASWIQGTVWAAAHGQTTGELVWHYNSGATERVPIIYGRNTARFWADSPQIESETDFPAPAWSDHESAENVGRERWLRLYLQDWLNPRPEETVTSLSFVSNRESPAGPFIIAINVYP